MRSSRTDLFGKITPGSSYLIFNAKGVDCRDKLRRSKNTYFFPMASSSQACHIKYFVFIGVLLISKFKGLETKMMSNDKAAPRMKYDVFVSFRGTDIRQGFLSHLITALDQKQILAFVDDKLERGDEISQALLEAIERSLISLIIFSQDYGSSHWCLEELVKIIECRDKIGQTVIPVFYEIDPSDVRHQKGNFANAFAEHEKKYGEMRVQIWRNALKDSANLSGFDSSKFRNDTELVHEIVKSMLVKLNDMHLVKLKGLVGIGKPISYLKSLLRNKSEEIRVIGIWGLGGIGKTTIAGEVYNIMLHEYDGGCFLASIREESSRHGINFLKKKLFSDLLGEQDPRIDVPNGLPSYVERRLGRMKVLIVLDDVNDSKQLKSLIGAHDWFGSGSRIIVTTRDKQVFAGEVDDIYEVEPLDFVDSVQLFNMNAFSKQNHNFDKEYFELVRRVVNYAKGIPLVLEVLAGLLCGKNMEIWESHLEKLEKMPHKEVHDIMRLSYDGLDREEQNIFLDIACFFHGLNMKLDYIRLLLKDDYSVNAGIETLKDKALITISRDNIVSMHDIIQETALEIAREDPSNQRRFWDPNVIDQLLESKGSKATRSISFNLSAINDLQLSPQVFANMRKLRFLNLYSIRSRVVMYCPRDLELLPNKGLYLPQGLEFFPNELRYLRWMHYPLKSLPTNFSAEKLVILDLPYNQMEKLWDGVQNLENLKVVDLRNSIYLTILPDFSKARNLEVLDLRQSISLVCLHPSISFLQKLQILDLGLCYNLCKLPSYIHLSSLRYLSLSGCVHIKDLSITSENLEVLNLDLTGIRRLPSSIGHQSKLENLSLSLSDIESLPKSIRNLTRLRYLDISYCWNLRILPELPPSLVNLDASGCKSLKTVLMFPSSATHQLKENKKLIVFWNCLYLDQHSLGVIALDAQINLKKIAYNHLSALALDYHKDDGTHVVYVYPGSQVPEWLVYRTEHNYVNIDISSATAPHSPLLGFIFCFIVPRVPLEGATLRFRMIIGEGEGNITVDKNFIRPYEKILTDHVFLTYDQLNTRLLNSKRIIENQQRLKIKVTAESETADSQHVAMKLKGFGVSPMSASEYHSIIQQLELGCKSPKSQISHFHCTTRAGSLDMIGNISSQSFCFQDPKPWLDFSRPADYSDGCWKLDHHVFINISCRHICH